MEEAKPMTSLPRPIFEGTFNYGHLVNTIMLAITIMGGAVFIVKWQAATEYRLSEIERFRQANVPVFEAMRQSDIVQNERMGNMADAIVEMRRTYGTLNEKLSEIGASVAVIKERTDVRRAN